MPVTNDFRSIQLLGAVTIVLVAFWAIVRVPEMLSSRSSGAPSGGVAPAIFVSAGTEDTFELQSKQPAASETITRPCSSQSGSVSFALSDERSVHSLLSDFPDLSEAIEFRLVDVRVDTVPDKVIEKIASFGQDLKRFFILGPQIPPDAWLNEKPPAVTDIGMEYISRMLNLQRLGLRCEFSPQGLRRLARLENLRTLGLSHPRLTAKDSFETVAKLPNIERLSVTYADFSEPIDDATHQAIASLNGRLVELGFGEWEAETKIHASLIPAIAEIESLRWLSLGPVVGSLDDGTDYRDHLQKLTYLERIDPSGTAPTLSQFRTRERFPVQYRTVESPGEMIVLLGYLIGEGEARKLPREIIRRRLGLSPAEDFTESRRPVSQILKESFDLDPLPGSFERLRRISLGYPEIDRQIRHYLSGLDIPVEP